MESSRLSNRINLNEYIYNETASVISFYYVSYRLYLKCFMYQNALCLVMYISEDSPLEVYKKYHEDDKEGGPFLFVGQ